MKFYKIYRINMCNNLKTVNLLAYKKNHKNKNNNMNISKILAIIYNSSYRQKQQLKHFKLQQQQCSICCLLQIIAFINLIAIAVNATSTSATASTAKLAMKTQANMLQTSIINDTYIVNAQQQPQQQQQQTPTFETAAFDKDVVDLLVKRYAPIVWLAPEEKFMPLGVDEFLNHVHPIDKDGLPATDKSEKVFLATNSNIDDLLQNEKSFIYGQNPSERAVPIYAMVTLCNKNIENHNNFDNNNNNNLDAGNDLLSKPNNNNNNNSNNNYNDKINNINNYYYNNNHATTVDNVGLTRGAYIPIKMSAYAELNKTTVLRPSRLYPSFVKRFKRELLQETVNYPYVVTPQHVSDYVSATAHELVTGETDTTASGIGFNANNSSSSSSLNDYAESASVQEVNNFIANLADNVKFSASLSDSPAALDAANYSADFVDSKFYYADNLDKQKSTAFHVTYWMFYPYSQGKSICTLSLGPLGHIPFPALYGFCLGRRKEIGNHIGDWEHMSLYFNGGNAPEAMYVSAHDAGAYYTFNRLTGTFEFQKQETRKGILQRPNFPKTVTTFNSHPVLFAAKGSHGLWTAPGKHRFVKVARLYDINGFGTAWNTWKQVEIAYENLYARGSLLPAWLSFKGKWGNPRSKCHPFRRIGLNFCEFTDGPTGIPLKEPHFQCAATAANLSL